MSINIAGVKQLLEEHKAIRVFVKRLQSLVDSMTQTGGKGLSSSDEIKTLRINVRNLSAALYHAKEAVLNHETRDIEVLNIILDKTDMLDIASEHVRIEQALENAIMQVDLANSEKWNIDELKGLLKSVKESVKVYHDLVQIHSFKEDAALSKALIESEIK